MKNKDAISKCIAKIACAIFLSLVGSLAYGHNQNTASQVVQPISDTVITSTIKAKYANNPILSVFDIHVETNLGVVTLSGLVDSDTQYERSIILAENTDGVKKVNSDNLKVKSSTQILSDTMITAKIKGLLLKNKLVNEKEAEANPWPIHIETKNGVVFITGTVANNDQKEQVIKTAKMVDGVKSVKADLRLK
jgi:hyperosmotically inducible protein